MLKYFDEHFLSFLIRILRCQAAIVLLAFVVLTACVGNPNINFRHTIAAFVGHDFQYLRGRFVNPEDFDSALKVNLEDGNSRYRMPYKFKLNGICMLDVEVDPETERIINATCHLSTHAACRLGLPVCPQA